MTDPTGPLDDSDRDLLAHLATVTDRLDPLPAGLDERVLYALSMEDLDAEVARLTEEVLVGSGARAAERTRTITFDAASRTIMVTVVDRPDGRVRIDGWLAPAAVLPVELRFGGEATTVSSDDTGRFVFHAVPHGLAQLRVGSPEEGARVVTPSLVL